MEAGHQIQKGRANAARLFTRMNLLGFRFRRAGNVFSMVALEHFLGYIALLAVLGVHGDQNVAFADCRDGKIVVLVMIE